MRIADSLSSKKPQSLHLLTSIYEPNNEHRKAEIVRCISNNAKNKSFQRVTIFSEKESDSLMLGQVGSIVEFINLGRRPTYADWIRQSASAGNDDISITVFANSDISFSPDLQSKASLELLEKNTILCITRHEAEVNSRAMLHPSPQWSQDAWCIRSSDAKAISPKQLDDLEIPIGTPRCDNRLAYIFWLHNWTLINPCKRINALHHHQSSIRTYAKKDASILGAVAYVYPSEAAGKASKIDVDIFTLSKQSPGLIKVNTFLLDPAPSPQSSASNDSTVLPWQEPNCTERHAADQFQRENSALISNYVAFPWATWIDRRRRGLAMPAPLTANTSEGPNRVRATVCQHIWALEEIEIFQQTGITDLFWSHATLDCFIYQGVRIHPFPLYPVRCTSHAPPYPLPGSRQRPLLYSFQGAYSPELYRSAVQQWIVELSQRPDACIALRSEWHFEQAVYREQVSGEPPNPALALALAQQANQYVETLQQRRFALCPSGSGPNSIRLWEALGYGAVPVILSDSLRLPGDLELWRQAALFVPETQAAIAGLPALLEHVANEPGRLDAMQAAGQTIWQRYGPQNFVVDVVELLANPSEALLRRAVQRLGQNGELLTAHDPTRLPLQVQRWCRSAPPGCTLVIRIEDATPLAMQELRWRGPLRLCRSLLADHRWTVSSLHPGLEALAESQP